MALQGCFLRVLVYVDISVFLSPAIDRVGLDVEAAQVWAQRRKVSPSQACCMPAYLGVAMNPPPEELARHSCAHTLWRELRFCKRKRLQLEANGDCHVAALLAMTRSQVPVKSITYARGSWRVLSMQKRNFGSGHEPQNLVIASLLYG
jgi:hypothetical protein